MFTGIVEEIGRIAGRSAIDGGLRLAISAAKVIGDLAIGDSIAVNGVCQTVIQLLPGGFAVEAVGETLQKTTMGSLQLQDPVNLERPLTPASRLGGHFVQGHVNATAPISNWYRRGDNWYLEVELPLALQRYVIPEGSIAIDGISLTIAALEENRIGLNIIPHTANHTNLCVAAIGKPVNIEVDMLARYAENLLRYQQKKIPIIRRKSLD